MKLQIRDVALQHKLQNFHKQAVFVIAAQRLFPDRRLSNRRFPELMFPDLQRDIHIPWPIHRDIRFHDLHIPQPGQLRLGLDFCLSFPSNLEFPNI